MHQAETYRMFVSLCDSIRQLHDCDWTCVVEHTLTCNLAEVNKRRVGCLIRICSGGLDVKESLLEECVLRVVELRFAVNVKKS